MGKGIPIRVLGTNFTIQTDEDPEYVSKLVSYIIRKTEEIKTATGAQDPLRLSIIASIIITDELFKERRNPSTPSESSGRIESLADGIIARIDAVLDE